VAEQWVCAWLRPHTVCVPSRKSRQDSERLRTWQGHETLRWPIGRRRTGRQAPVDASPRGREGRLGEDHSECISDQQLQPGVVEEDQPRSPHRPTRSANQRIQWKARPKAKEVVDSPGQGPERLQPVRKRLPRSIDHREAEGVTNTLDVWGSAGVIQIWNGLAQSSADVFGHATTHRVQRL
jgi:hypothetical protein